MESDAPTQWSDALSRHQNLLAEHRSFLSSLLLGSQTIPERVDLLGQCLEHVEAMMLDVKKISTLFNSSNGPELSSTAVTDDRPEKAIPKGPRLSPDGPFVTGMTRNPGDESFRHSQASTVIRIKRRAPDEDEEQVHATDYNSLREGQRHKKARIRAKDTRQEEQLEQIAQKLDSTKTEHVETSVERPVENLADDNWFALEVEEALRKKEIRRLKKLDKKRKRHSGTSDVSMPDVGPGDDKPQKKKQKGIPPSVEGVESMSQSTAQSGDTTPQTQKGKNKRPSPAAEYISSILQQVQESARKKRQRAAVARNSMVET